MAFSVSLFSRCLGHTSSGRGQAKLSPQFWETVLGEGLRQGQVPFELQVHQASQPSQGQCGQLVVSQVPRRVYDQGYWQSMGLLRGQGFVEGAASVPGMKQEERNKEHKINTGDSVCSEA